MKTKVQEIVDNETVRMVTVIVAILFVAINILLVVQQLMVTGTVNFLLTVATSSLALAGALSPLVLFFSINAWLERSPK